jgi:hypothetical protein
MNVVENLAAMSDATIADAFAHHVTYSNGTVYPGTQECLCRCTCGANGRGYGESDQEALADAIDDACRKYRHCRKLKLLSTFS